jgi:hypothetical protein
VVNVSVAGDTAVFELEGLDKLWALRSRLAIPLTHITAVEHDPEKVGVWWHGWKLMGADLPGVFAAGTFYYHGELVFWDVSNPADTIVVSLNHERYKKLILEVEDPEDVMSRIRAALPGA